jgi:hypothetical protein
VQGQAVNPERGLAGDGAFELGRVGNQLHLVDQVRRQQQRLRQVGALAVLAADHPEEHVQPAGLRVHEQRVAVTHQPVLSIAPQPDGRVQQCKRRAVQHHPRLALDAVAGRQDLAGDRVQLDAVPPRGLQGEDHVPAVDVGAQPQPDRAEPVARVAALLLRHHVRDERGEQPRHHANGVLAPDARDSLHLAGLHAWQGLDDQVRPALRRGTSDDGARRDRLRRPGRHVVVVRPRRRRFGRPQPPQRQPQRNHCAERDDRQPENIAPASHIGSGYDRDEDTSAAARREGAPPAPGDARPSTSPVGE